MAPEILLTYRKPANRFIETVPIANGNSGTNIFGGIGKEVLYLNESTFWSGEPSLENFNKEAKDHLQEIRNFYLGNDPSAAERLTRKYFNGIKGNYGTNLPVGNLEFGFIFPSSQSNSYKRQLNLNTGVQRISFTQGSGAQQIAFTREYFASNPANLIICHFGADKPNSLSFDLNFTPVSDKTSPYKGIVKLVMGIPQLIRKLRNRNKKQSKSEEIAHEISKITVGNGEDIPLFIVPLKARDIIHSDGSCGVDGNLMVAIKQAGGNIQSKDSILSVQSATEVMILISIKTTFSDENPQQTGLSLIKNALSKPFEKLKEEHIQDFSKYMNRMEFSLGNSNPTDGIQEYFSEDIIPKLSSSKYDLNFIPLLYQYGRYLLLSSSRSNSVLPASLQGIYNDNRACRMGWTNDFHLDINTQMNYWIAETCNLTESHAPLFRFIKKLAQAGEHTATNLYGCKGWVAHTVTNAWAYTAPGWEAGRRLYPSGGAWIATHLWDHYQFTLDQAFLKDEAYPILKSASLFYLDYLKPQPTTGYLIGGPSCSPEHAYKHPNGKKYAAGVGMTATRVGAHDMFSSCLKAAKILGFSDDFTQKVEASLNKLPPFVVTKEGRLQEWPEDYQDVTPNHRHTSHLISLYPSSQISLRKTPELARAASKTLQIRNSFPNWEGTGWSLSNFINFYARLEDSVHAKEMVDYLIRTIVQMNLFVVHPPLGMGIENIFELDGNTGFTAGITEMLFQSHDGELNLLPALPDEWHTGKIKGLCGRGGFVVNIEWKAGKLTSARILSKFDAKVLVRYHDNTQTLESKKNSTYIFDSELKMRTEQ